MIDSGRLAHAVHLDMEQVGTDRLLVSGGADDRLVVILDGMCRCDCVDAERRGDNCKHSLIVRLSQGDRLVVRALRDLVPVPGRSGRAA